MPLGRCNRARQDSRTGFEPDFRLKKHAVLTQKRPILTPFQRENRKIQGVRQKRKVQQTLEFTGLFGGELGIRTLEAFRLTAFRVLHLRPLGQLSIYVIPLSFEKLFARTDGKNNKIFNFQTEQKLNVYGETVVNKLPTSQKTSSQLRYDHFDTPPNYSKHYNIISLRNKNVKKNL